MLDQEAFFNKLLRFFIIVNIEVSIRWTEMFIRHAFKRFFIILHIREWINRVENWVETCKFSCSSLAHSVWYWKSCKVDGSWRFVWLLKWILIKFWWFWRDFELELSIDPVREGWGNNWKFSEHKISIFKPKIELNFLTQINSIPIHCKWKWNCWTNKSNELESNLWGHVYLQNKLREIKIELRLKCDRKCRDSSTNGKNLQEFNNCMVEWDFVMLVALREKNCVGGLMIFDIWEEFC